MRSRSVDMQTAQAARPRRNIAKTVAKTALASTVAAGTVLVLAKKGKLDAVEGGNKYLEKAKSVLKKPADFVLEKGAKLAENVRLASKGNRFVSSVLDRFEIAKSKVSGLKDEMAKKVDTVRDFVESKINKDKFSETVKETAEDLFA